MSAPELQAVIVLEAPHCSRDDMGSRTFEFTVRTGI